MAGNASRGEMIKYIRDVVLACDQDECLIWPFSLGRGMLMVDGKRVNAARYVCTMAHGEPRNSNMQAAHSCGNGHKSCVNKRHIRWATPRENSLDKIGHGTHLSGENVGTAKLSDRDIVAIRWLRQKSVSRADLATAFGVSYQHIARIELMETRVRTVKNGESGD
ncbi:helix-turn-helix domain-containing protein [Aliirhizobium cellulosilyticum]|uniref:HNH nuclease domain-containing protein n=1 Tax=Aliirhizobium cellulosilyticum TaxID=393664 RepID=A0A7W6WNN0_9HYPH|nr:helix-turn-helix transcriptional regulator [Rhizobium cellulosilyticum]MBB4348004.1 hypothetical protein [Rhizobium cellulosilyticum]MBB4409602.1 hypothetical protein [Rhizobium cellulosilyticum]MBB4444290.1 hypothetical protein [Rhizobium cellulosilyticum]